VPSELSSWRVGPKGQLNKEIIDLSRAADVLALFERRRSEFEAINVSTALHRVAKHREASGCRTMQMTTLRSLTVAALSHVGEFNARELSGSAWALARLVCRDQPLLAAISSAAIPTLTEFLMQNLVNTAWAFSALGL